MRTVILASLAILLLAAVSEYADAGAVARPGDILLPHGMRWGMSITEVKASEKLGSLIDEFEMDNETTVSFKSYFPETKKLAVNISYFFFEKKLYSILYNFLSKNENEVISNYHAVVDYFKEALGKPVLEDTFKNIAAWQTNGTVLSIILGPVFVNTRKYIFNIQYDCADAGDIRLKIDKARNLEFNKKEKLEY